MVFRAHLKSLCAACVHLFLTPNSRSVFRAGMSLNIHSFIHSFIPCVLPYYRDRVPTLRYEVVGFCFA